MQEMKMDGQTEQNKIVRTTRTRLRGRLVALNWARRALKVKAGTKFFCCILGQDSWISGCRVKVSSEQKQEQEQEQLETIKPQQSTNIKSVGTIASVK